MSALLWVMYTIAAADTTNDERRKVRVCGRVLSVLYVSGWCGCRCVERVGVVWYVCIGCIRVGINCLPYYQSGSPSYQSCSQVLTEHQGSR